MSVDIILCENFGPALRQEHNAVNRCPCCGKKDFEVLVEGVDITKAFAVLAAFAYDKDPEFFKNNIIEEINEWSEDDDYIG